MSFLKISNPARRDAMVRDFLQTRKNIQRDNLYEKTGELEYARQSDRFFKPMTDTQTGISNQLKTIKDDIHEAITHPLSIGKPRPVLSIEEGPSQKQMQRYGRLASRYLMKLGEKDKTDKTFGLYYKEGTAKIGNKPIEIDVDDFTVAGKKYTGTEGLWYLITSKNPDTSKFTDEDFDNYKDILINM